MFGAESPSATGGGTGTPSGPSRREVVRLGVLLLPLLALYIIAALMNHGLYGTTGFDLAIFDQGLWHASRFETPTSTVRQLPSILGDHWDPAILLLSPLYWVGDGTRNLLAAQPVVVLLAAFPIFNFARRRMESWPATLVAVAYAVSWGVGRGLAFDFHELALAAPALAFAIDRFDARDDRSFWIAALALLLTKEDQSLTLAMFFVLALLRGDRWKASFPLLVGGGWFLFATRVLMPWAAEGRAYEHWVYGHLAPTPGALVVTLLTHPVHFIKLLFAPSLKVTLWIRTFGTFAFLPLLSPYALLALPSLFARLLSSEEVHWFSLLHYSMPVMAIMACAAADGLARIGKRLGAGTRFTIGGAVAVLLVSAGIYRGSVQIGQIRHPKVSPERARALERLLANIPPDASVTADNVVAPHLSKRRWILVAADKKRNYRTDYYVFDPDESPSMRLLASRMRDGREYEEIGRAGETRLYRRRAGVAPDLPARPQDLPSYLPEF